MTSSETLETARRALTSGRLDDAKQLAEQILVDTPAEPNALQIAGIASCQLGDTVAGAAHLNDLAVIVPDDAMTRVNLGNALIANGEPLAAADHLERAVELAPEVADAWHLLGIARRNLQQIQAAMEAWAKTLELQPEHSAAAAAIATATAQRGDPAAAEAALRVAVEREPRRPALHHNLGIVLAQQGKFDEAVSRFETTLGMDAQNIDAREALSAVLEAMGRFDEAVHHLRQAVRRRRDDPDLRYKLASVLERNQQAIDAMGVVNAASTQWPEHAGLRLVKARIERRNGRVDEAVDTLAAITVDTEDLPLRQALYNEKGRLADMQHREAEAIDAFTASNAAARAQFEELYPDENPFLVRLNRLTDYDPRRPSTVQPQENTPIFIVGCPRSGTTLAGRILASHSQFEVLEEVDTINAIADRIEELHGGYPAALDELSDDVVEDLRTRYWQYTDGQRKQSSSRLVDKMPLNLLDAALIDRLFPGAPIIHVARDPRDVVLSAFMQPFAPTPGMSLFFTLEDAAQACDTFVRVWERAKAALDLNVHEVNYESLVTQFDETVSQLLSFLDVEWEDSVREFYAHANNIKTASSEQVSKPIYQDAVGRWQRYEPWLPASLLNITSA